MIRLVCVVLTIAVLAGVTLAEDEMGPMQRGEKIGDSALASGSADQDRFRRSSNTNIIACDTNSAGTMTAGMK